ncbi:UDP-GlcNAc:betaGal beta-1,3-N-acetylglucosaminyltransferase-like protein 1 isoform X2 [Thrips palmi]|nr:UDP-GlcNAc:betaGal beta-1,3-N-acetylglucosaminyltransferase-like protein 1 isoform X2 [Thrips palmi]XP_034230421.1 UDP-GlcNAc:betaGal beta-1,3-N-acetylglucosaminyltransferase-like protein 1 isoform X2 [Thrips palmi]XP_034230422.1 UDP-GlcNAc:betaGal beta-1,3-N-acetylglucosaminyltransferase-like protein 1 isoform X2 [Thrips palmi]XP_034230423.1 UDP-GlcNAc:betaGal beta-1,3-N-acetylglucosaminyltransferase-like protein 1 isoform X2 [Thrips palmi]
MASIHSQPEVSIIIPVYNGSKWLDDCFKGILSQNILNTQCVEVSIYNDSSTDDTEEIISKWQSELKDNSHIKVTLSSGQGKPQGVGFAKNRAVEQSCGSFLCFQDVDDVMLPHRIHHQLQEAEKFPEAIIGCKFVREPPESTERFTRWANELSHDKLGVQIYTSHGPTIVMPTWFCTRKVFDKVGGFSEAGQGTPEDLIFFYKHLDLKGKIRRVDEVLLMYRYHENATTFSIHEDTIWNVRLEHLTHNVLKGWPKFTIWNAGKQGRKFYRSLAPELQDQVLAMCDVDVKKIGKHYQPYYPEDQTRSRNSRSIPILDYQTAKPPFVICLKLDLTAGNFERNLASLKLVEAKDYIIFS